MHCSTLYYWQTRKCHKTVNLNYIKLHHTSNVVSQRFVSVLPNSFERIFARRQTSKSSVFLLTNTFGLLCIIQMKGPEKQVGERVSTNCLHIFSLKTIILNYNYITKHKCGNENICNNDVWKWISAGEISLGVSKKKYMQRRGYHIR